MPPLPPGTPPPRDTSPLTLVELEGIYEIIQNTEAEHPLSWVGR